MAGKSSARPMSKAQIAAYIAIAVVVATLAAGLYPAYKAGRVSPVEAIRIV